MLTITIPASELYDERTEKFVYVAETKLVLEHSLVSLSKWEQLWEKPFLGNEERSNEETLDYIRCMIISPEFPPEEIVHSLTNEQINTISNYINSKMTATWFGEVPGQKHQQEVVTAEIIYYWLVALQVPFEVQTWHLNRLLTLVRVINIKSDPEKKMMPRADAAAQQRMLNEQRKAKLNTKG